MQRISKTIVISFLFLIAAAPARADAADPDAAFALAMRVFCLGDSWTAKDILEENIADNPQHSLSYSGLGFIHMMGNVDPLYDGSPEVALDFIEQARALGPDNIWNHLTPAVYAVSRYMQGDLAAVLDVEKHTLAARRLNPEAGEPYLFLWIYYKFFKGDRAKTDKSYAALLEHGMQFINVRYMLHYAESFFGTCDAAVAEASRAVAESPADAQWYIYWEKTPGGDTASTARADCLYWKALLLGLRGGELAKQEQYLKESLSLAPAFYEASIRLASVLQGQSRTDEALQLLRGYHAADPAPGSAFALAYFFTEIKPDPEQLKTILADFPKIPPGPYAWSYLGRLAGLHEKAGETQKAAELRQSAATALKNRGQYY
jgi:tetratricopeptide (TPR) repeat protein